MRILPLAEAKAKLSQLVDDVESQADEITITRNGRPVAVLVSYDDFESWSETLAIVSDPEFVTSVRKGVEELRSGTGRKLDSKALDRLFAHRE
jgi:prevent-host-death family protein